MPEKFNGTIDDLVISPHGSVDEAGYPVWHCSAHSRRKRFAELELGQVVLTVDQFREHYPQGFRNSMAARNACQTLLTKLLADDALYYVDVD